MNKKELSVERTLHIEAKSTSIAGLDTRSVNVPQSDLLEISYLPLNCTKSAS